MADAYQLWMLENNEHPCCADIVWDRFVQAINP